MAHNPSHANRRKLATPDSASISQKHPNPSSTSTIYNLTNHFSRTRLHPNNSNPNFNPKPANANANANSHPQKHIEVKAQAQALALSKSANNSSLSLGQDFRKQGKMVVLDSGKSKSLVVVEDHKKKKGEQNNNNNNNNNSKYNKGKATLLAAGNNGKRRSCSDADVQIELSNFLVTNCAKVVSADMPPFMQIHAVAFARKIKDSLEKFTSKNLAFSLKKELDGVYGPAWHCIVGTSFGSFVTHSVGGFLYFSLDQKLYVLIFKTAVQKA